MTRSLIDTSVVTHAAEVPEDALRLRLAQDLAAMHGLTDAAGELLEGVTYRVTRGEGRKGGYQITVSRRVDPTTPKIEDRRDG